MAEVNHSLDVPLGPFCNQSLATGINLINMNIMIIAQPIFIHSSMPITYM